MNLSCYHHRSSSHESLVSFAPWLESPRMRGVSGNRRGNTLKNVDESSEARMDAIFGHNAWSGPLKSAVAAQSQQISLRTKSLANGSNLTSLHEPSDERLCRGATANVLATLSTKCRCRRRVVSFKNCSPASQPCFAAWRTTPTPFSIASAAAPVAREAWLADSAR